MQISAREYWELKTRESDFCVGKMVREPEDTDCSPCSSHGKNKALKGFSKKFVAIAEV